MIIIIRTYLLIISSFLGGLCFPSLCDCAPPITTNPLTPTKDTHVVEKTVNSWTIEQATQQKIIKGVFPAPNSKLTLVEMKNPYSLKTDKKDLILKDTSQIIIVEDTKKIIWATPEHMDCFFPQWSPDGKEISFISYDKKEGVYSLWSSPASINKAKKITSQKQEISGYLWSPDGKHIAVLTSTWSAASNDFCYDFATMRTYTNLIIIPIDNSLQPSSNGTIPPLLPKDYFFPKHFHDPHKVMAWSPDSQNIIFVAQATDSRKGGLYTINIHSKKVSSLHEGDHPLYPMYSLNGNSLAFVADSEKHSTTNFPVKKRNVFLKNLKTGEEHALANTFGMDPSLIGWSHDNQFILIQEGYKTLNKLYRIFIDNERIEELSSHNQFLSHVSINRSGTSIGFVAETLTTSPQAFVSPAQKFMPLTVLDKTPEILSLKTELIHWTTFDGKEIEGILIYPFSYEEGHSYPTVVGIHDGPYSVWTQTFMGAYSAPKLPMIPIQNCH